MKLLKSMACALAVASFVVPHTVTAEVINIGGDDVWLDKPENPAASLVIVPGGGGLSEHDPLQRLRQKIAAEGFAVLSVDARTNLKAATKTMADIARPVSISAVSRGVMSVTKVLSSGRLKMKKLVLVAGDLNFMQQKLGTPSKLPKTLVIHHRRDGCKKTPPSAVEAFEQWAGGKVTVVWLDGGRNQGNPCGPDAYHGLAGLDGKVVDTIVSFLK